MKTGGCDMVKGVLIVALIVCAEAVLAQAADECRVRADESPPVRLLEQDGNRVTVHVLDPDQPDQWQVLSDADEAGHTVAALGSCGNTALQIYLVARRSLTGGIEQNERPDAARETRPPVSMPPSNPPRSGESVNLACRGTYTECYGRARAPVPAYTSRESDGSRAVVRVPGSAARSNDGPGTESPRRPRLDTAIDQCLGPHFAHPTSPDWSRFDSALLQADSAAPLQSAFPIVQYAVNHTLAIEKRVYGKLPYGENSYAYLEGWLGRCLWDAGVLSKQEDPRAPYAQFLSGQKLTNAEVEERYHDWDAGFRATWSPWPWHVYRERQLAR